MNHKRSIIEGGRSINLTQNYFETKSSSVRDEGSVGNEEEGGEGVENLRT